MKVKCFFKLQVINYKCLLINTIRNNATYLRCFDCLIYDSSQASVLYFTVLIDHIELDIAESINLKSL